MEKITLILRDANIPKHHLHTRNSPFYVANTQALCHKYARNMHRFCAANASQTHHKHSRLTPKTRPKDVPKAPVLCVKCAANASEIARFHPAFCPISARKSARFVLPSRLKYEPFCAANVLQTCPSFVVTHTIYMKDTGGM